ncbi:hypothetical protein Acr_07g0011500 [Actinidia rufa]|uniref:DUF4283 domain-containing protein n=1 Tax=Actinidia rufa TaxID=165716 RepID=A0A7J0EWV0_9ERIC|nr:hypothetical protein Acr_07g0011500 [Actinidia rufa]
MGIGKNEKSSSGVSKNRTGAAAAAASTLVKQQELAESSKAAMEISNIVPGGGRPKTDLVLALEHVSEEEKSDEESEDALQTLGEEDSTQHASKVDGQIKIEAQDMQELDFPWERSLFSRFENEAISCFPVWIQLRNLPLELWSPNALGKICSKIGKPIHTDKMTANRERVSYARCLVEVNMAKELTHSVIINLPNGDAFEQVMFYENLPRFCTHCKVVGHSEAGCSVKKIKSKNNQTESTKTTEVVNAAELESGAAVAATGSQAATSIAEKSKGRRLNG